MNNLGTMYLFELRKIFLRKTTVIVLSIVTVLMIAMNIGEYIAGRKIVNIEEKALVGRVVDDAMLDEMREAIELKKATTDDGETVSIGVSVLDKTYEPLFNYLYMVGGNYDKAYNMTEENLYKTFNGVIDDNLNEQYLSDAEKAYWEKRRADNPDRLIYGEIQNGYGDSATIIYSVSILVLIAIAATLSGVFADEVNLKMDSIIFSSVNGKKRLMAAKMLAGVTVGFVETLILLAACVGTEFAISGLSGQEASVQFFVGPSAMDMEIGEALVRYVVIMLIIGIMFSVMAMSLSQITHSTIPVVAFLMLLWLMSMVNIPDSLGILARIWNFMPVTFLGSWNFNDYHLVPVFGHMLTNIEAAPLIYPFIIVGLTVITIISYNRYQIRSR